jgi:hypothetical protein
MERTPSIVLVCWQKINSGHPTGLARLILPIARHLDKSKLKEIILGGHEVTCDNLPIKTTGSDVAAVTWFL